MKNKIFLSLALLVAANAFIATPAMAYTLADAKRDAVTAAKGTGKTALGLAALGTSAIGPALVAWAVNAPSKIRLLNYPFWGNPIAININDLHLDISPKLAGLVALTTSVISGYAAYNLLKSAWNDFKTINKK